MNFLSKIWIYKLLFQQVSLHQTNGLNNETGTKKELKQQKTTFRTFLGFMSSLNFFRCNSSKFLTVHELCLLFLARVKIFMSCTYKQLNSTRVVAI